MLTAALPRQENAAAVPPRPLKLLDRVRWHLRVKHYSIRTEVAYLDWIRRFILFHGKRHPEQLGEAEIAAFLSHLAINRSVARVKSPSRPSRTGAHAVSRTANLAKWCLNCA